MQCCRPSKHQITVSTTEQTLTFHSTRYSISTSRFGIGSLENSNKTPLGKFQICEKFGCGESLYTIYKGRKKTGLWTPSQEENINDLILTRILRLSGIDLVNHNTYKRYIYIHGTNAESHLGSPFSIGCIRMQNNDMVTLYNKSPLGTTINII